MADPGIEVLSQLRARGLRVARADGESLAVTPASLLDDRLRAAIRASKAVILAALEERASDPTGIGAVKLRSHRFGRDLWLARDERVVADLINELEQTGEKLPILLFAECEALRGKSPAMIRATLDALTELPGSRVER